MNKREVENFYTSSDLMWKEIFLIQRRLNLNLEQAITVYSETFALCFLRPLKNEQNISNL